MHVGLKVLLPCLVVAGCATVPTGPSVMVLPGSGRSFDEFRADETVCRDYAWRQIGGESRAKEANEAAVGNAALGTALGALAGAAIGGRDGAGFGAGMGLLIGSSVGAEGSERALRGGQRQYDIAYVQCMYARGHRVPMNGSYTTHAPAVSAPPSAAGNPPPPPPGSLPPPPAR